MGDAEGERERCRTDALRLVVMASSARCRAALLSAATASRPACTLVRKGSSVWVSPGEGLPTGDLGLRWLLVGEEERLC